LSSPLIFSITPYWAEMILSGRKTVELRRRPPKLAQCVAALIYETRPRMQISALCSVGPVISAAVGTLWARVGEASGLHREGFERYFDGLPTAHAIVLSGVTALKEPVLLQDLRDTIGFRPPQSWCRASESLMELVRRRL